MGKRLLLVDGHSLANRAFYALPPLSTNDGTPTGAVFGFLTMLLRFLSEKRPTHVAIAFDLPAPTFRHTRFAEYKAQRKPAPPEFKVQIPLLKQVLDVLRLPRVEMEGYEADDIIGTLARQWKECGWPVTILSGDKDCLQLVDDGVEAILPVKGISQVKEYGPDGVREDMGIRPDQVRDYKALRGDTSDNIPGVKGIGEKTATALMQQFGNLDEIYEHLSDISPARVQNLLAEGKDMAFLSRELATIDTGVPLSPCDVEQEFEWRRPDLDEVRSMFTKMEFTTLIPRLTALAQLVGGARVGAEELDENVSKSSGEGAGGRARNATKSTAEGAESSAGNVPGSTAASTAPVAESPADNAVKDVPIRQSPHQVLLGISEPSSEPSKEGFIVGEPHSGVTAVPSRGLLPEAREAGEMRLFDSEDGLKELAEEITASKTMGIYAIAGEITKDFLWPESIGVSSGKSHGVIRLPRLKAGSHGIGGSGNVVSAVSSASGVVSAGGVSSASGVSSDGNVVSAVSSASDVLSAGGVSSAGAASNAGDAGNADDGSQDVLWRHLGPLLVNAEVAKTGFDLKWVFTLCFKRGITPRGAFFDILIAAYLLDPTRTNYRLPDMVRKYAGFEMPEMPETRRLKAAADADETEPAPEEEAAAAFRDSGGLNAAPAPHAPVVGSPMDLHLAAGARSCLEIAAACRAELEHSGLVSLAQDVEFPLIEVLAGMEATGVGVDLNLGRSIRESFGDALRVLEEAIHGMAGEKFNLGSPKQLAHILFDELGLKPIKKTKTGYSTDAEVLEQLSLEHELPAKILEYRQYAKLKSTYLDVLESVVNPTTGRIHSTFHQTVTATGRLSSSEPNLQNIPVRGDLGRSLRRIFVPAEGRLFLASDYSQIELRIMAHMADDPSMIDAFVRGEDIHTRTASEIFGVPADKVDSDLRSKAKAVNFGIIYGISDFGLARNTGVSRGEARTFIEAYFARYPKVREFMDRSIETARQFGYVTTILGRRRGIPEIDSRIRAKRGFAERTAINTPIQGSAADIIKLAMVRIYRRLRDESLVSRLILQVHDELIFEIPPEEEELMKGLVREEMESVISLKVPLKVDIDVGKSWYDV